MRVANRGYEYCSLVLMTKSQGFSMNDFVKKRKMGKNIFKKKAFLSTRVYHGTFSIKFQNGILAFSNMTL